MFYHKDWEHLTNNLFELLICAGPVYGRFGAGGLYSIFLGSGIFSALNNAESRDKLLHEIVHNKLVSKNPFPTSWKRASSSFNSAASYLSSFFPALTFRIHLYYGGCGAAILGLTAASCCACIENVLWLLAKLFRKSPSHPYLLTFVLTILEILLNLLGAFVFGGDCHKQFLMAEKGMTDVDTEHGGHVSAIKFGLGCYVVFWLCSMVYKLCKKTPKVLESSPLRPLTVVPRAHAKKLE